MSRASDFKLMDRQAAEEFLKLPERNVFFRALSSWVGFKTTYVEFDVQEREAGESKWSFKSLVRYAVNNITSFSAAPMQIVTFLALYSSYLQYCLEYNRFICIFLDMQLQDSQQ